VGVIPHLVDDGLFILQYADDTIIFLDHDLEQAKNMKLLLCAFQLLSGLKINFHKSEIFCYGAAKEMEASLAVMLENIPLDIWGYLCTIDSCSILSGIK